MQALLGILEDFCVGINAGIYDRKIFFRMCGSPFVRLYYQVQAYIDFWREKNPRAYIEMEKVAKALERQLPPRGSDDSTRTLR